MCIRLNAHYMPTKLRGKKSPMVRTREQASERLALSKHHHAQTNRQKLQTHSELVG